MQNTTMRLNITTGPGPRLGRLHRLKAAPTKLPVVLLSAVLLASSLLSSPLPAAAAHSSPEQAGPAQNGPEQGTADPAIQTAPDGPTLIAAGALTNGRTSTGVVAGPSDALIDVPVESELYSKILETHLELHGRLTAAESVQQRTEARLQQLGPEYEALQGLASRADVRLAKLETIVDQAESDVRSAAVSSYTSSAHERFLWDPLISNVREVQLAHEDGIAVRALKTIRSNEKSLNERLKDAEREAAGLYRQLEQNLAERTELASERTEALAEIDLVEQRSAKVAKQLYRERGQALVVGSDLPLVALDAYWRAAEQLARSEPQCRLGWSVLAGIGRTESNHGRIFGGSIGRDGLISVPIIGIPLDGTNNTALIVDTDLGEFDTDLVFDRAVGPMQFIPSTWRRYGRDGNGDTVADPHNLYDAALSAGRYLCYRRTGLDEVERVKEAILAYNRSDEYVATVYGRAEGYQSLGVPSPTT